MSSRAEQKAQARAAREAAERAEAVAEARRRRLRRLGGVLAVAAIVLVAAILVSRSTDDEPATPMTSSDVLAEVRGIPQDGPWLGSEEAPVVLEEYADLQCPFCAQFSQDVFPEVARRDIRTGRVRMRLRLLTFIGDDSVRAARFAAATGLQDHEWEFVTLFYASQGAENSGYVTDDFLRQIAERIPGLDVERAFRDRTSDRVTQILQEDAQAAREAQLDSTPSFLAGRRGEPLTRLEEDPSDVDAFRRALAELQPGA